MKVNVTIMFDKARALEAAMPYCGSAEGHFLSLILPSINNQCTTNEDADIILSDLRAVVEGYYSVEDYVLGHCDIRDVHKMLSWLRGCEAAKYAVLQVFGHNLPVQDARVLMGNSVQVNLYEKLKGGLEITSNAPDVHRVFEFLQWGLYEIVREILCRYIFNLQEQTSNL